MWFFFGLYLGIFYSFLFQKFCFCVKKEKERIVFYKNQNFNIYINVYIERKLYTK